MVVIRDPITLYFSFDWPKDFDENLKHEVEFMIKSNESLAENKKIKKQNKTKKQKKTRWSNYCLNISMATIFMSTENSKKIEPHKFVLNLSQKLHLRSSNKHVALQNLSVYYTWKNVRKQYKNNKR